MCADRILESLLCDLKMPSQPAIKCGLNRRRICNRLLLRRAQQQLHGYEENDGYDGGRRRLPVKSSKAARLPFGRSYATQRVLPTLLEVHRHRNLGHVHDRIELRDEPMQAPRKLRLLGERSADSRTLRSVEPITVVIEEQVVVGDHDSPRHTCRSTRSLRTARNSACLVLLALVCRLSAISSSRQPSMCFSRNVCRSIAVSRCIAVIRSLPSAWWTYSLSGDEAGAATRRSASNSSSARGLRRRIRSIAALSAMRWIQVSRSESPRNSSRRSHGLSSASWSASAARAATRVLRHDA